MTDPRLLIPFSVALTLLHVAEETFGRDGPLWLPFGDMAGHIVPDWFGVAFFVVGLSAALSIAAIIGYCGSPLFLGVIVGARTGDSLFSHWLPTLRGHAVPGNATTPLFILEAAAVVLTLPIEPIGVAIGAVAFLVAIPTLRLTGVALGWDETDKTKA